MAGPKGIAPNPTIFVAIASYCDPVLPRTLDDCLEKAHRPENLRFGLCRQYDDADDCSLQRFRADSRFQFADYSCRQSQGGSWARAIAQEFWAGETYTLQVDSHMAFAPGWDVSLIRMMRTLPAQKPLVTINAPLFRYDDAGRVIKRANSGIRATRMADWKPQQGWAPWFDWGTPVSVHPARSRYISGNFVFTLGAWNEEVRQDPEHYYWGEEFALTLRSFTHGYDLFLPDQIVAWHMEHVAGPPRRHWEHGQDVVSQKNAVAFERLRLLAFCDDPQADERLGRYGLGRIRSREEYERFAGMDLANKRLHPDTFSGRAPDPVTIQSDADWSDCVTMETLTQIS